MNDRRILSDEAAAWRPDEPDLQSLIDRYLDPSSRASAPEASPPQKTRPSLGSTCSSINEYVLQEKIGEGGMGIVYRAFDQKLQRDVALKVLLDDDEEALERFLREREITACLDHPNFVRILATGYLTAGQRSLPFYTMPLIRGMTLEKLVLGQEYANSERSRLRQEFPPAVLLRMVGQLCLALQSAHDRRIIHRDLKPANILVGPYGEVYVTDFGLAKILMPTPAESVRFESHVFEQLSRASLLEDTSETMMGTPYYMAPEQAAEPRSVDQRADIFGLGALLYYVLTGRKPHYESAVIDRERLLARKGDVIGALKPFADPSKTAASLLDVPRQELPDRARRLVEEYREILGLLSDMDFYKLRLTLKECRIVPPNELLSRRKACDRWYSGPEEPIPPNLEAVCMKALARDPEERFPNGRALCQAIHGQTSSL